MYHALIIDTETNGREGDLCEVIELAVGKLEWEGHDSLPELVASSANTLTGFPTDPISAVALKHQPGLLNTYRFCPKNGSTYKALSVHNIPNESLTSMPESSKALDRLSTNLPFGVLLLDAILVGHNVSFDHKALGSPKVHALLDTLALSRLMWPDPDGGHNLGGMMYRLFGTEVGQAFSKFAHGAAADVYATYKLLEQIILKIPEGHRSALEVARLSEALQVQPTIGFGKYKGARWRDIDPGYMMWYIRQAETDPAVVAAMKLELEIAKRTKVRCPVCDGNRFQTEGGVFWLCDSCGGAGVVVSD